MNEHTGSESNELFKGVRFYSMGDLNEKIKEELINGKAKAETYLSAMVTHAIVSDCEHYELDAAQNMWQIPTVTPSWVKMSILCKTLLPTKGFLPVSDQLFGNVVACFSNIPKLDKTTLWALITYYGGKCQTKLNKECTHLITPLPAGDKFSTAVKHDSIKIVAPDWITDSVKLKELQSCEKYSPDLNIIPSPVKTEPSPPTEVISEALKNVEKLTVGDIPIERKKFTAAAVETKTENNDSKKSQGENQSHKQTLAVSTVAQHQLPALSSSHDSLKMSSAPAVLIENSQKVSVPIADATAIQMARHQTPQSYRQATNVSGQRYTVPTVTGMRHPHAGGSHPMLVSGGQQFAMVTSGHQVYLNQPVPGSMITADHQRTMPVPSPSYMVVSSAQSRPAASPRRGSSQNSGGKKKKPSNRTAMAGHPNIPQGHPLSQFQANPQAILAQQQHHQPQRLLQKLKMPVGGNDQIIPPGQNIMEGSAGIMGARFSGIAGPQTRFAAPSMIPQHDEHIHQQLLQQQQQQQQMQRMALMRQSQPANAGVMNQIERMQQQKWSRQPMDPSNFVVDQQGHQFYTSHGAHQGASSGEDSQSMHQVVPSQMPQVQGMPLAPAQNAPSHQHYNPAMVNRFNAPINPQQPQQQIMFQQMQQHPTANRFPTSTSLEAAGIAGISPFALQQGILNADTQADNPPLIHPSLQGMSPKVATSSQNSAGSATPKKRVKSRKKTDGMDDEGKARQRQRSVKVKKSPVSSTGGFPVLNTNVNPMQSPNSNMLPPQPQFHSEVPKIPVAKAISAPPGVSLSYGAQFNNTSHPIPPSHAPSTASTPSQHLANDKLTTSIPPQSFTPPNGMPITQAPAPAVEPTKKEVNLATVESKPPAKTETEPSVPSRDFVDPLTFKVSELESEYITRTPGEAVPEILFLLGCVFHIAEYETIVNDISVIDLWKSMIGRYGGIVEDQYIQSCTHVICATCTTPTYSQALADGKRCVSIYWLNDVLEIKTLRVPWLALHVPTHFTHRNKPATKHTLTYTNFHVKERYRLKTMGLVCGATLTGYLSQTHTGLLCKSYKGLKYDKASSWSIPCINTLWLRDVLQSDGVTAIDITDEKYLKPLDAAAAVTGFLLDISKAKHILHAWKTPIVVTQECLLRARVKHKFDPMPPSPSQPKRLKPDPNPKPMPRVCFTGLPLPTVLDLTKKLDSLNGRAEPTFALCTHLVANNICRTSKFLSCISHCSYVVTPDWIEDSFKSNWLLDESKYLLEDKVTEENLKFSLQKSVKRANAKRLFKDCLFCVSSGVTPKKEVLKQIIECAGGTVLNKIPALSVLKHTKARKSPDSSIIIISCPNDEKFYKQLKKEGLQVHNAEIVLTGVLKQEIDLESYRL